MQPLRLIKWATFHNSQVVNAHVSFPDDLVAERRAAARLRRALRLILSAERNAQHIYNNQNMYGKIIIDSLVSLQLTGTPPCALYAHCCNVFKYYVIVLLNS